jgi:hypothetical protein
MKKPAAASILIVVLIFSFGLTVHAQNETRPAPATPETAGFEITRLVVGTSVDNREPVGVADTFPAKTPKVICFLDAKSIAADTDVTFVWILNGKELLKTNLPLKAGPNWRTRADKNLHGQTGDWTVEVRNAAGKTLRDVKFKVE